MRDEAVSLMVYHELEIRLNHYTDLGVWLSRNYNAADWEPAFRKEQETIDGIRLWAKTLPRGSVRSEYLRWLEYYYQWGLDEARKELKNKTQLHEMEQYYTSQGTVNLKIKNHPEIPKPPSASDA